MNKARRAELAEISTRLENLKSDIEVLRDDEQEYIDVMPESLLGGERALMAEGAVSNMDDAINSLDEAISSIEGAQE